MKKDFGKKLRDALCAVLFFLKSFCKRFTQEDVMKKDFVKKLTVALCAVLFAGAVFAVSADAASVDYQDHKRLWMSWDQCPENSSCKLTGCDGRIMGTGEEQCYGMVYDYERQPFSADVNDIKYCEYVQECSDEDGNVLRRNTINVDNYWTRGTICNDSSCGTNMSISWESGTYHLKGVSVTGLLIIGSDATVTGGTINGKKSSDISVRKAALNNTEIVVEGLLDIGPDVTVTNSTIEAKAGGEGRIAASKVVFKNTEIYLNNITAADAVHLFKDCTFDSSYIYFAEDSQGYEISGCTFSMTESNLGLPGIGLRGNNHKVINNKGSFLLTAEKAQNCQISGNGGIELTLGGDTSGFIVEKNELTGGRVSGDNHLVQYNKMKGGLDIGGDHTGSKGHRFLNNQIQGLLRIDDNHPYCSDILIKDNVFDSGSMDEHSPDYYKSGFVISPGGEAITGEITVEGNTFRNDAYISVTAYSPKAFLMIKKNDMRGENTRIYIKGFIRTNIENNAFYGAYVDFNLNTCETEGAALDVVIAFNHFLGGRGLNLNQFGQPPYGEEEGRLEIGIHDNIFENIGTSAIEEWFGSSNDRATWIYNNIFRGNCKGCTGFGAIDIELHGAVSTSTVYLNKEKTAVNRNIIGGTYLGGNYWDRYTGADNDGDGLGDTPHLAYRVVGSGDDFYDFYDNLPLVDKGFNSQNISVTPDALYFGAQCGGENSRILTVQNTGGADLKVDSLSFNGIGAYNYTLTDDTCSGKTLAPSGSCTVTVNFSPEGSAGDSSVWLNVFSNDPDSNITKILCGGAAGPGDLNGDCQVDMKDGILSLQVQTAMNVSVLLAGDVNGDGQIGAPESMFILRTAAKLRP